MFTDIHEHLLYGIDDGAKDEQMMHDMLLDASRQGVTRIVATPHITPGLKKFDFDQYHHAIAAANAFGKGLEPPVEVLPGAEILFTPQTCHMLQMGKVPALGHTQFVLIEFLPDCKYAEIEQAVDQLLCTGYLPILAHAERYLCLKRHPRNIRTLKQKFDVRIQVNMSCFIKKKGWSEKRFLRCLIKNHWLDAVATDAHNMSTRKNQMAAGWATLVQWCGESYARKITNGSILEQ